MIDNAASLDDLKVPPGNHLAQEIHVPVSRIQDIIHDRRKITADTSLRLARFFGVSDRYFLDIQNDIDLRELKIQMNEEIQSIKPYNQAV
ncbi:MAG: HigA family addiction module antidote protein [Saccharofermentans sp.]|nr:HigA family addiction module antidote protein [Saccharofermentans sp.]